MFGIGIQELGLILVVALLVFGPKRLPELARTLGRGMAEFRRASTDLRQSLALDDIQNDLRKGMTEAGSILKPELKPELKPKAKSETPTPETGEGAPASATAAGVATAAAAAASGPATPEAVGAADLAEAAERARKASSASTPHPGELPLGNDHEHHDVAEDAAPAEETSEPGEVEVEEEVEDEPPAANELGAVPVAERPESRRG